MSRTKPHVIITMPAYHAERTLEQTVAAIPADVADEMILVDDASKDATVEVARGLGLRVHVHPVNRGYGGNQKSCYSLALESGADIVVLLHPDYQYEPKAVPLLIAPILAGDADMTFGSRFAGMGDPRSGGMPLYRYVGNRLTTIVQNALLGTHFTEMHSGMRAYTRSALLALPFLGYPEGFSFDAALLIDAVSSGLRVVEVPIPTRYTKESSSISVVRSLHYVADGTLFAGRATFRRGRRGSRYLAGWRARASKIHTDGAWAPVPSTRDLESAGSTNVFRWMLSVISTYHVGSRAMLGLGSSWGYFAKLAEEEGWAVTPAGPVDVIVMVGALDGLDDHHGILSDAKRGLTSDGLLAIHLRRADITLAIRLLESGFRVVSVASMPRSLLSGTTDRSEGGTSVLLIARPNAT